MINKNFNYINAKSVEEACSLLARHKDKARLLAGGTDLLIRMRKERWQPEYVIDLKGLGLDTIEMANDKLIIGATAAFTEIEEFILKYSLFPALAEAIYVTASRQIKNRASLGGNLCNASPSADGAPPLLVYGGTAVITGPSQAQRKVAVEDFFTGPGKTVLEEGELLTSIEIPFAPRKSGGAFLKFSRTAVDLAAVSVASYLCIDDDGTVRDAKIALGAVAPTPVRAKKAESILSGNTFSEAAVAGAARAAVEECSPITDIRATEAYRKKLVAIYVEKTLHLAKERAGSSGCEVK